MELSKATSVSIDMIKRYEYGDSNFSYCNAKKLSSFFNIKITLFYDDYLWFVYGGIGNKMLDTLLINNITIQDLAKDKWYLYNTLRLFYNRNFNKINRRSYVCINNLVTSYL